MSENFDLGALMSQLSQVQQNITEARAAAAAQVVEGSAGGGAVKVKVTGALEVQKIMIDPSVVDQQEVEMLEDLVLAAIRDALEKAGALTADALGDAGLGGALGGLLGQ